MLEIKSRLVPEPAQSDLLSDLPPPDPPSDLPQSSVRRSLATQSDRSSAYPPKKPRPELPDAGPAGAGLSIAEAARRTGVSVHTLRYYERAGLVVNAVGRTSGGRRRYQQRDLNWIIVCTKLRATGMPIQAIRRYAQLVSAGPGNEQERLALLEAHRTDVLAKLAEVHNNLALINHKIDVYRGRLAAGDADRLWAPTD